MIVRLLSGVAFAALLAPAVAAQGTTLVTPADLAYREVDRLAELGVLDSLILAQRPYSRREFGRIVRVARVRLDRADATRAENELSDAAAFQASAILQRLQSRFTTEADELAMDRPVFALFESMALSFGTTDAIRRPFAGTFGAALDATLDPLEEPRLGRPAVRGQTTALELGQRIEPTGWLSVRARERLEYRMPTDTGPTKTQGELLLASVRARARNVALTVGREEFVWTETGRDGLFLSRYAPALDQISLASDHPFLLPSVLRAVGPMQATLILANLGPSTTRSYSKLLAYKVSVQPRQSVELGATFMNHYGGEGGRPSSFGNRLIDFLPFVDIFRSHNYTDPTRELDVDSDKLLGVNARVRIAALAGVVLSGELLADDFDVHRLRTLLTWDGAQSFAMTLPNLAASTLTVRLMAQHTGVRTYTHSELRSGLATRSRLLGSPIGTDAKSFTGMLEWAPAATILFALEGGSGIYSNATYVGEAVGERFVIRRVGPATNELRDRLLASIAVQSELGLALVVRGGAERIRNANFTDGRRKSYVVDVALRLGQ